MSVIERWTASLTSNQRGKLLTRRADTREQAFAIALALLDDAADHVQMHGERLAVEIEEAG
jgi:hypothetical protein